MADLVTFNQYKMQTKGLKNFFKNEFNGVKVQPINLFPIMKKYGVKIFHTNGGYLYLPDDWAVEFFIQSKTPITDFTESPAVHFILKDSFDMAVSLSVSSALKTDENPSECFCVGTVDAEKYFYEPLNISLLDGNKHYVAIMCQHFSKTVEEVEKDFCYFSVYVDLKQATAKTFELSYDNFQDFSTLIFGVDAFLDNPCVDNLVTFDEILVTKNLCNSHFNLLASWIRDNGFTNTITSLFGDWSLDGKVEYPHIAKMPETFNASDNTVLSYKNGVLTFYPNVSDDENVPADSDDNSNSADNP